MNKSLNKTTKEWISTIIIMISTSIIIFINIGQSLQLLQLVIPRELIYWIAGIGMLIGILFEGYLNKI